MDVVLYQDDDGPTRLDVRLDRETVWLTQDQMAELFGRESSVITKHLRNVFREGELDEAAVRAKFAHTADDGKTYQVQFYNLDAINSHYVKPGKISKDLARNYNDFFERRQEGDYIDFVSFEKTQVLPWMAGAQKLVGHIAGLSEQRNKLVAALADEVSFAYTTPGGRTARLAEQISGWSILNEG